MPVDTQLACDRCAALLPTLDPQMRIYLEVALREAQLMQLVRQVAAGDIVVDGTEDEE